MKLVPVRCPQCGTVVELKSSEYGYNCPKCSAYHIVDKDNVLIERLLINDKDIKEYAYNRYIECITIASRLRHLLSNKIKIGCKNILNKRLILAYYTIGERYVIERLAIGFDMLANNINDNMDYREQAMIYNHYSFIIEKANHIYTELDKIFKNPSNDRKIIKLLLQELRGILNVVNSINDNINTLININDHVISYDELDDDEFNSLLIPIISSEKVRQKQKKKA